MFTLHCTTVFNGPYRCVPFLMYSAQNCTTMFNGPYRWTFLMYSTLPQQCLALYIYLVTRCSRQKPDDILAIIGWILVSQISDVDLVQDWGFNCSGAVSRTCDGQLSYRAFSTIRYTVLHPCACVCVPLACIACRVYY